MKKARRKCDGDRNRLRNVPAVNYLDRRLSQGEKSKGQKIRGIQDFASLQVSGDSPREKEKGYEGKRGGCLLRRMTRLYGRPGG